MDFNFTAEEQAIHQSISSFAEQEIAPYASQWDEENIFPKDALQKSAQLGLGGLYINTDVGGTNLSRLLAAIVFEILGKACVSTAAYLSIHNMVAWVIDHYGNSEQRNRWLPALINMTHFGSYCLTEPEAGSDAASLKTTAVREGDHYRVNGSKAFISGGSTSDIYICMVRTGEDGTKGISCLVIEKNTPGLSFGPAEKKLGWNNQKTTMIYFENCLVPVKNLIHREGVGFNIAMNALNGGRINISACSLGGAHTCLHHAQQYMKDRKQFHKKLTEFQALRFKLADMYTNLEASRLMTLRAACSLDKNSPEAPLHCAMAKRLTTDICFQISDEAMQIFGGYGYLKDYPIERFFRDLRVNRILEGTNEIMRMVVARHILSDDFTE